MSMLKRGSSRATVLAALAVAACASVAASRTGEQQAAPGAAVRVERLRTEYKVDSLGLDARRPRLSWELRSVRRAVRQTAYQVRAAASAPDLTSSTRLLWDSQRVESGESIHRRYEGPPLRSRQRVYWQVRVWDGDGVASPWSEPAWWEMGLLSPEDWEADWIEPGLAEDPRLDSQPPPMVRREFRLDGDVRSARAYVTAHGLYEVHLNGRRVGDQWFTPGWTSYRTRLQYQTYDVTDLVRRGENALGVMLGNGWYRGRVGFRNHTKVYGDRLALLLQLEVTYRDGRRAVVTSDGGWKAATGPVRMSEFFDGETYDARLERAGWAEPGFDDGDWSGVGRAAHSKARLIAAEGPPVRRIAEIRPVEILTTPAGDRVVDMGQNMVGWVRLRVRGPAGATVTLRHAEVLDRDGNLYTENLRRARQRIEYTLKGGGGEEVYEPRFTFQGFRYVAVDGYPGDLTPDSLTGIVVHSDVSPAGELTTSDALINRLQHNIVWGLKGNFVDVPTDCPQRDERLGWTGDAQVFARTASFNADVAPFFSRWLKDLAADQYANGAVPWVIPDVVTQPDQPAAGAAGWADAATIIPWTMYLAYGDRQVLEDQYPSMVRWVEYMRGRAGPDRVWQGTDWHFGDWLAFATTRSDYPGATTGKDLIATAFFAQSTALTARAARILRREAEAVRYEEEAAAIRAAFVREFVTPEGRVGENTQTAYVLALQFDLLPDALRQRAAARLASNVRERGHLTTGFLGTPYLLHVLARYGYLDEAYGLLERREYPSWLYPVTRGATTIWERWDGIRPDGTFQDAGMNSFNHYAYGAVGEWIYRVAAGLEIDPAAPGYRHVLVQPRPGGTLTSVSASHQSMYGRVASSWKKEDGRFELNVEVPPNARATVRLPHARLDGVTEGGGPLDGAEGVHASRQDGDAVVVEIGSGAYRFAYAMP